MPEPCQSCPFAGCPGCDYQARLRAALQPLVKLMADRLRPHMERIDQRITEIGARMADEAEAYANEESA